MQAGNEDAQPFIDRYANRQSNTHKVTADTGSVFQCQHVDFMSNHCPSECFVLFSDQLSESLGAKPRDMIGNLAWKLRG
jgi:hypothetical protein